MSVSRRMKKGAGCVHGDMKIRSAYFCTLLLILAVLCGNFSGIVYRKTVSSRISVLEPEDDAFRSMQADESWLRALSVLCQESGNPPSEFITPSMLLGEFRVPSGILRFRIEDYLRLRYLFLRGSRQSYEKFQRAYQAAWDDVVCFPVEEAGMAYENSWMFERNYGGKRGHEGTDLMPPRNLSGYYRVVSMTDGIIEKIGWLEKGGYRIGIRSPSGGYYYYAHLDSYAEDFHVGEALEAGQFLGYMGDTGYGPEGTRGQFDVHLHVGIYIRTDRTEELSVNPYWVLRYAELYK